MFVCVDGEVTHVCDLLKSLARTLHIHETLPSQLDELRGEKKKKKGGELTQVCLRVFVCLRATGGTTFSFSRPPPS